MTIGEKLRQGRQSEGLSCREFGAAMGISPSTVAMYERNERVPSDSVKVKYAARFGTTVGSLFFNENRHAE